MGGIPSDAITGHLTQRTPAGYIKEQKVIDAFTKVRGRGKVRVRGEDLNSL